MSEPQENTVVPGNEPTAVPDAAPTHGAAIAGSPAAPQGTTEVTASAITSDGATDVAAAPKPVPLGAATVWQLIIPVLWFGMVLAISFLEAPLKFQAPGITIPLGLGIGRLVFSALNGIEAVLCIALIAISVWPRISRAVSVRLNMLLMLAGLLLLKIAVVRPPLNARTDLVLDGAEPGQSPWHYIYIACDVLLLALLAIFIWQTARIIRRVLRAHPVVVAE